MEQILFTPFNDTQLFHLWRQDISRRVENHTVWTWRLLLVRQSLVHFELQIVLERTSLIEATEHSQARAYLGVQGWEGPGSGDIRVWVCEFQAMR